MQNRFLVFTVTALLAIAPALADNSSTTTNVNPSNTLSVNPTTNQSATTANIATQINNQNVGVNAYGGGIACQSPQIAVGGYGARQNSSVGLNTSNSGISIEYLAPVGNDGSKSCHSLAEEVLKARKLDNAFTTIQRCVDFARAGVALDPAVYPELAHACSGIRVTIAPQPATPAVTVTAAVPNITQQRVVHFSDFSPEHNSELRRIALHRLQRLAMLEAKTQRPRNARQRALLADRIRRENAHLRAEIAEYDLENAFLRGLMKDQSWHARTGPHQRIISYNPTSH